MMKITKEGDRYIGEFKKSKNSEWEEPIVLTEGKEGSLEKNAKEIFGKDWESIVEGAIGNKIGFALFKMKLGAKLKGKTVKTEYFYVDALNGSGNLYRVK